MSSHYGLDPRIRQMRLQKRQPSKAERLQLTAAEMREKYLTGRRRAAIKGWQERRARNEIDLRQRANGGVE